MKYNNSNKEAALEELLEVAKEVLNDLNSKLCDLDCEIEEQEDRVNDLESQLGILRGENEE
jgi:chromosome segregation ATPase